MIEMLQTYKHELMPVITKISDKTDKPQKFHLILKKEKKSVIFLLSLTIWMSAIYDTLACAGLICLCC